VEQIVIVPSGFEAFALESKFSGLILFEQALARFIREGTANGGWYHDFEAKTPVAA
jgi:hypothetical protein